MERAKGALHGSGPVLFVQGGGGGRAGRYRGGGQLELADGSTSPGRLSSRGQNNLRAVAETSSRAHQPGAMSSSATTIPLAEDLLTSHPAVSFRPWTRAGTALLARGPNLLRQIAAQYRTSSRSCSRSCISLSMIGSGRSIVPSSTRLSSSSATLIMPSMRAGPRAEDTAASMKVTTSAADAPSRRSPSPDMGAALQYA